MKKTMIALSLITPTLLLGGCVTQRAYTDNINNDYYPGYNTSWSGYSPMGLNAVYYNPGLINDRSLYNGRGWYGNRGWGYHGAGRGWHR